MIDMNHTVCFTTIGWEGGQGTARIGWLTYDNRLTPHILYCSRIIASHTYDLLLGDIQISPFLLCITLSQAQLHPEVLYLLSYLCPTWHCWCGSKSVLVSICLGHPSWASVHERCYLLNCAFRDLPGRLPMGLIVRVWGSKNEGRCRQSPCDWLHKVALQSEHASAWCHQL